MRTREHAPVHAPSTRMCTSLAWSRARPNWGLTSRCHDPTSASRGLTPTAPLTAPPTDTSPPVIPAPHASTIVPTSRRNCRALSSSWEFRDRRDACRIPGEHQLFPGTSAGRAINPVQLRFPLGMRRRIAEPGSVKGAHPRRAQWGGFGCILFCFLEAVPPRSLFCPQPRAGKPRRGWRCWDMRDNHRQLPVDP